MKKYKAEILMFNTKLLPKALRIQHLTDPKNWSLAAPVASQVQKLLGSISQLNPPIN